MKTVNLWAIVSTKDVHKLKEVFVVQETDSILDIVGDYVLVSIKAPSISSIFSFFETTKTRACFLEMILSDKVLENMIGEDRFLAMRSFLSEVTQSTDAFLMERLVAPFYDVYGRGRIMYNIGEFYFQNISSELYKRLNFFLERQGLLIEQSEIKPPLKTLFLTGMRSVLNNFVSKVNEIDDISIKDISKQTQDTTLLIVSEFILRAAFFYSKSEIQAFLESTSEAENIGEGVVTLPPIDKESNLEEVV